MPILIQNFASRTFLSRGGRWTKQFSKALQFDQILRAWEEIDERNLSGVQIMFHPADQHSPMLDVALSSRLRCG